MKKKHLQALAGISTSSMSKMSADKYVSMEVLVKVCEALNVDIGEIMEVTTIKQ